MKRTIGALCLLVRDYDEAIAFYTRALGFALVEDTAMGGDRRWVLVEPSGSGGARLLLAKAKNEEERAAVGRQSGGRVFLFLHTDDFARDHAEMSAKGVRFCESPREEAYGTVAVFEDLYGNKWDLLMPKAPGLPSSPP
jgi:catechol 2,3-dioxygenase-like lactoylglutathione lyase family enzyme